MDRRAFLSCVAAFSVFPGVKTLQSLTFARAQGVPGPASGPLPGAGIVDDGGAVPLQDRLARCLVIIRSRALAAGLSEKTVDEALEGLTLDDGVVARDTNQPEFHKPIGAYVARVVGDASPLLYRDRTAGLETLLADLERRHGVDSRIVAAIWGVESSFGRKTGDHDVIRALATQAAIGRRSEFAISEMIAALRILDLGLAERSLLKGSWAGAMGQTQFMPSDYLAYAEDGDGDGRRDIWTSSADALASTANFLEKKGKWRRGGSWAREAIAPPGFDFALADSDLRPIDEWFSLGVRLADAAPLNLADVGERVQLLAPAGHLGPLFFAFPNHMAIRTYNNSTAYALSVGLLADRFGGRGELVTPFPDDPPLSLADRIGAQRALARLGFDPGTEDGVLGMRTRKAVKAWQKGTGLPADGYLTLALIDRLRKEAGQETAAGAVPSEDPIGNLLTN